MQRKNLRGVSLQPAVWAAIAVALSAWGATLEAKACTPLPSTASGDAGEAAAAPTRRDGGGRVIAPIRINGQGPFRLIVDTGANRSVISTDVANALQVAPNGTGEVHSINGVEVAPVVPLASLTFEGLALASDSALVMNSNALMGENGVLGVDSISNRRLRVDFERGCMEITSSDARRAPPGWFSIQGELRFGNLLIARGRISDVDVAVLVDTGSDTTLANEALREALGRARIRRANMFLATSLTSGRTVYANEAIDLPPLQFSSVSLRNLTAYPGEFHIFQVLGLQDQPALLIGMDAISHLRAIEVDYGSGRLYFKRGVRREPQEALTN